MLITMEFIPSFTFMSQNNIHPATPLIMFSVRKKL